MKARTRIGNCEVYFTYEDYYGNQYGSWRELASRADGPMYLIGYAYSPYYNYREPIDEMSVEKKPSIGAIKGFIKNCIRLMED